jgi:hypothetical protein
VIIDDKKQKWIKFYEGTEYLIKEGQISIEKKNYPFVRCQDGRIQVEIDDIIVRGEPNQQGGYGFTIEYTDGNRLTIDGPRVSVTEMLSTVPYVADVSSAEFSVEFGTEALQISTSQILYTKNGVRYNPN